MKLEVNGRNSCTGNSRHIDIRYFFVKDRVSKGEVKIEYCPTEIMLADFFTKPAQGSLFKFFRDIIMGYKSIEAVLPKTYESSLSPKIKERVENSGNDNQTILKKKMIYGNNDKDKRQDEKSKEDNKKSKNPCIHWEKKISNSIDAHVEDRLPMNKDITPVCNPTYAEITGRKVRKKLEV